MYILDNKRQSVEVLGKVYIIHVQGISKVSRINYVTVSRILYAISASNHRPLWEIREMIYN